MPVGQDRCPTAQPHLATLPGRGRRLVKCTIVEPRLYCHLSKRSALFFFFLSWVAERVSRLLTFHRSGAGGCRHVSTNEIKLVVPPDGHVCGFLHTVRGALSGGTIVALLFPTFSCGRWCLAKPIKFAEGQPQIFLSEHQWISRRRPFQSVKRSTFL